MNQSNIKTQSTAKPYVPKRDYNSWVKYIRVQVMKIKK